MEFEFRPPAAAYRIPPASELLEARRRHGLQARAGRRGRGPGHGEHDAEKTISGGNMKSRWRVRNGQAASGNQYAQHLIGRRLLRRVMGIRVLRGQPFSPADERGETDARMVDSSMAGHPWRGRPRWASGIRPYWAGKPLPWRKVSGVVNDVGLVGARAGLVGHARVQPARDGDFTSVSGILVRGQGPASGRQRRYRPCGAPWHSV